MWTSHAGGGGHGLPRAARQGTRQVDVKSATRGVLTGRPGSGARAWPAVPLRLRWCARKCWSCACVERRLCRPRVAAALSRASWCGQTYAGCGRPICWNILISLLRVSYRWVRAFRRRCLQRRRWRRRLRPRRWKLSCHSVDHARMPLRRRRRSFRALPPLVRSHLRRVMSARTSWPRRSREFHSRCGHDR